MIKKEIIKYSKYNKHYYIEEYLKNKAKFKLRKLCS